MLHGLILTVHILACFVLIAVILLQAGRGGGLADTGGGTQSILGTRGAAFLTKATTAFAVIFMLTSLSLAYLSAQQGRSLLEGARVKAPVEQAPAEQPAEQPQPASEQPAPQP